MASRRNRKSLRPDTVLLVMFALVIGTAAWVFAREGVDGLQGGLEITLRMVFDVGPEVLLGIGLAGMLQVAVPPALVSKWMGESSGPTGIAVGMAAGIIMPGGPYILFPIAASLVTSGAGIGPLAAFVAVRNSATINRLAVWEIPLLGIPFSLSRIVCSVPMVAAQIVLTPIVFQMMPEGTRQGMLQRFAKTRPKGRTGST